MGEGRRTAGGGFSGRKLPGGSCRRSWRICSKDLMLAVYISLRKKIYYAKIGEAIYRYTPFLCRFMRRKYRSLKFRKRR